MTARNFNCDFFDSLCEDARCKLGFCVPAKELREQKSRHQAVNSELEKEAMKVARDLLDWIKGIRSPTDDQVRLVARNPKVIDEARRRIHERGVQA